MFVMFHLTLVGPDNACADGNGATTGSMRGHQAHHHGASGVLPHSGSHQPCETPNSSHCCEAVTSCAVTLAVVERGGSPTFALSNAAVHSPPLSVPLSRSLAPEPPPPKA
jgi:hypothetical protein